VNPFQPGEAYLHSLERATEDGRVEATIIFPKGTGTQNLFDCFSGRIANKLRVVLVAEETEPSLASVDHPLVPGTPIITTREMNPPYPHVRGIPAGTRGLLVECDPKDALWKADLGSLGLRYVAPDAVKYDPNPHPKMELWHDR